MINYKLRLVPRMETCYFGIFSGLGENMVSAANDVAQTLQGDKDQILSDLLKKLRAQAQSRGVVPEDNVQSIM